MTETNSRGWIRTAFFTVPLIILAGTASGWMSGSGYGNPWFDALAKPAFMPPGWTFGVAWTLLYALMGVALAMILAEPQSPLRKGGLILFFVQLALNFAWSPVFFAGHDIKFGAVLIFAILVLAAATAALFRRIRPVAGLLLLPYLIWLCFAGALNTAIETLNPDAGLSLFGDRTGDS